MGHILELYCRDGFDAGFIRDEYGCILDKCECAHYSQTVIGKIIESTFDKLMRTIGDSGGVKILFWDQNIVNDEYVIAYELDYSLHQNLQNMLPKVYLLFRSDRLRSVRG